MNEDMEPIVQAFLDDARRSQRKETTANMLNFFADLLALDRLPESGRAYVANVLRAVADDDARAALPTRKKPPGPSAVHIFAAFEKERAGSEVAPGEIHKRLAVRLGIKESTVARVVSQGRQQVRAALQRDIGPATDRDRTVAIYAQTLGLSPTSLELLLA